LLAQGAQSHYLWIDASATQPVLRFGELEEGAIERSPGRLDEMVGPKASKLSGAARTALEIKRGSDGFAFPADVQNTALVVEEDKYVVRDWTANGMGIVKPMFYARHAPSVAAIAPALTLDVVPAGSAQQFVVWFRNQPLANTAIKIIAPNGWTQERKTAPDGKVQFSMPWRGQYIVEAIYIEATKGEFGGTRYDSVRHRATLTIAQPNGESTFKPL
jgi:hypothetical protein